MNAAMDPRILRTVSVLTVVLLVGLPAHAKYGGGTGTPEDPYQICTAEQMNQIGLHAEDWDKHFKLMADIDLAAYSGTQFNIIGVGTHFRGTFDGDNHTISNFSYKAPSGDDIALFGRVLGASAMIRDLELVGADVDAGGDNVASLVGWFMQAAVSNCRAFDCNVSGGGQTGGLVGLQFGGTIDGCYVSGNASGEGNVGGLVGRGGPGTIRNSHTDGSVRGTEAVGGILGGSWAGQGAVVNCHSESEVSGEGRVGGIVGLADGTITSSYATGNVSGNRHVGGLVGANSGAMLSRCYSVGDVAGNRNAGGLVGSNGTGTLSCCYSAGSVHGSDDVGGLVGSNGGTITDCFWDSWMSGKSYMCGDQKPGATGCTAEGGKSTAKMQTAGTFLGAGWDFVGETENGTEDIWCICEGEDYPKLTCQFVMGDVDGDHDTDLADFCALASHWGGTDGSFWCGGGRTDLTGDGQVDFADLEQLAENWLTGVQ